MPSQSGLEQPGRRVWVIIPAAGRGDRMGAALPKQYLALTGRAVIAHTLERITAYPLVAGVTVVLAEDDRYWGRVECHCDKPIDTAVGGRQRCHSVLNGLDALAGRAAADDWVLVHDAARPCVRLSDIDALVEAVAGSEVGGLLATPVHDTMKRADAEGLVRETLDRASLWHALTPQMFRYGRLRGALAKALSEGHTVTDESSAMELAGDRPVLVAGHTDNIKITRPGDLRLAEFILAEQARGA